MQRKNLQHFPVVLLSPYMAIVVRIGQFNAKVDVVTPLNEPSSHNRLNVELSAHRNGIDIFAFVLRDRTAGHHSHIWHS